MINNILFRAIFNCKTVNKPKFRILGNIQINKLHTNEIPVKEIQVPTQWGHVAGKLWGSDSNRPILALHGWQDNAGTWDTLAPMLCQKRSILAIDFPGHGLSSWIPPGMHYFTWEYPRLILYLKEYFKWDKVSLLSHSMGSIAAMRYACIFPDDVDFYIGVDNIIYDEYDANVVVDKYAVFLKKGLIIKSLLNEEPPSYTLEEATKIWHQGTKKSVALDSVKHLLKRGAKKSKHNPNKYYFSRDPRLKYILFNPEDKVFVEAIIRRLKCPTLNIKAMNSPYATDAFSQEMRELLVKSNNLECVSVPGTHHVHLNNPELVAPLIVQFLKKHNIDI